jgi:FMN phosphatase YigB (HAD superfamily)
MNGDDVRPKIGDIPAARIAAGIRGLVFDLDNTLLRTDLIPFSVVEPAVTAIVHARGEARVSQKWRDRLRSALYRRAYDQAATDMGLSETEIKAGFAALSSAALPDGFALTLFPDAEAALADLQVLRARGLRAALVTRGFAGFQKAKVANLGIEGSFDAFSIDAIDEVAGPRFHEILRRLANDWNCTARELLVIDDDERKLDDAARLGMNPILIDRSAGGVGAAPTRLIVKDLREITDALLEDAPSSLT